MTPIETIRKMQEVFGNLPNMHHCVNVIGVKAGLKAYYDAVTNMDALCRDTEELYNKPTPRRERIVSQTDPDSKSDEASK